MARVAADENFHHLFYRDLASAAIELDPSATMIAIDHEVRSFAMPGTGIPNFDVHAQRIARAGIYDLNVHHEQILVPIVMRQWKVAELTGLSAEAEKARDRLTALPRARTAASRPASRSDASEWALPRLMPASSACLDRTRRRCGRRALERCRRVVGGCGGGAGGRRRHRRRWQTAIHGHRERVATPRADCEPTIATMHAVRTSQTAAMTPPLPRRRPSAK